MPSFTVAFSFSSLVFVHFIVIVIGDGAVCCAFHVLALVLVL